MELVPTRQRRAIVAIGETGNADGTDRVGTTVVGAIYRGRGVRHLPPTSSGEHSAQRVEVDRRGDLALSVRPVGRGQLELLNGGDATPTPPGEQPEKRARDAHRKRERGAVGKEHLQADGGGWDDTRVRIVE